MTGSQVLIIAVVCGALLYLLLRRRGSRKVKGSETPLRSGSGAMTSSQRPVRRDVMPVSPARPGSPAGSRSDDSGSSHPAYPVAPAVYPEYAPRNGSSARREGTQGASGVLRAADRLKGEGSSAKTSVAPPDSDPAARPWYPQAPASYNETEDGTAQTDRSEGKHSGT